MSDFPAILRVYESALKRAMPVVLATVVNTSGSTYRRSGARMLMTMDGQRVGVVSGGCLEADVNRRGWAITPGEPPVIIRYDTSAGEDAVFEFGLGCAGVVDVLIERLDLSTTNPQLVYIANCLNQQTIGAMVTVIASSDPKIKMGLRYIRGANQYIPDEIQQLLDTVKRSTENRMQNITLKTGELSIFIEAIEPPMPLVVIGGGVDALPVTQLAHMLGWHVTLLDRRPSAFHSSFHADRVMVGDYVESLEQLTLNESTCCVLMTHQFDEDVKILPMLLNSRARYVGMLGPASRRDLVLQQMVSKGYQHNPHHVDKLYAPIGLDIGADRPVEIALSIIAQIQATIAGYPGGQLHERGGPIHKHVAGQKDVPVQIVVPVCEISNP